MICCFQTNNVGKLNLEQIDDHDQDIITTLKLSNLKQLKVKYMVD